MMNLPSRIRGGLNWLEAAVSGSKWGPCRELPLFQAGQCVTSQGKPSVSSSPVQYNSRQARGDPSPTIFKQASASGLLLKTCCQVFQVALGGCTMYTSIQRYDNVLQCRSKAPHPMRGEPLVTLTKKQIKVPIIGNLCLLLSRCRLFYFWLFACRPPSFFSSLSSISQSKKKRKLSGSILRHIWLGSPQLIWIFDG